MGEELISWLDRANNVRRKALVGVVTYQYLARQEVEKEPTGMYSWRVVVSHYPRQRPSLKQKKEPRIATFDLSEPFRCSQLSVQTVQKSARPGTRG